jgi:hypothetical protein
VANFKKVLQGMFEEAYFIKTSLTIRKKLVVNDVFV